MRNRVERLRVWLLGSAVFLVLVIAAFIGYARHLKHHFLANLPHQLGLNIESDANGWTMSHAVGGKTSYSIHAAKWERTKDGKMELHDVSIMLYGPKADRHDRIYGDEFEYDQDAGVVKAKGLVHIEMQTAGAADAAARNTVPNEKLMFVTTSGLVYLEKLGVAATSDPIDFQTGAMKGHAVGADYASDSGIMILHSAVTMNGFASGRPVALTAATAEFDDHNQVGLLTRATYESEGRSAAAEQATLHRREDGTLSRIEAQGNVTMQAKGATVVSQKADVALNAKSQPESALLTGGVRYSADEALRQMRGESDVATIAFDREANPQPQHAVFTGRVHMTERTRATAAVKEPWSTRDLLAAKLDAVMAAAGPGKSELRDAEATGSPKLTIVNNGSLANSNGEGTTELSADDLKAHLIAAADPKQPSQLDTIVGRGHTVLRQMSVDGIEQVSSADALDAKMRPKTALAKLSAAAVPGNRGVADSLESAVQQGHVTMMRRAPAKGGRAAGGDDVEHATAQRAVYDGNTDRMTLTGGVQVSDAGSVLWANQVALEHKTGDAHALGAVKMNYVQDASTRNPTHGGSAVMNGAPAEPTHILADRADLDHATDVATFYGKPARLWQGGDQVQAPVIEFSRAQRRLIARGEAGTGWSAAVQAAQVHTVLAGSGSESTGGPGTMAAGSAKAEAPGCANGARNPTRDGKAVTNGAPAGLGAAAQVVRVASGGLVYSDILRQADFTGGFRADTVDGTIRAAAGTVYLAPAPTHDGKTVMNGAPPTHDDKSVMNGAPGLSLAGGLERVIATGHVELDKPGLQATGERLVYTASDRVALLTGDAKSPPEAVNAQGTTTGAALRFQSSCDGSGGGSVEAVAAPGQPVHTDAQVSDDGKKEKGKR